MPTGNLVVQLSDMAGEPARGPVEIDLRRVQGAPGAGGADMSVSVPGPVGALTVTGIPCQTGPGTMYEMRTSTPHYRKYAFFQLIQEDRDNTASDDVEFWVKPGDVAGIQAPALADLTSTVQTMLGQATMIVNKPEDSDLVGLSGNALYQQMGPLRKACLLNIAQKAGDARTADNCLRAFRDLLIMRQDRLFARVTPGLRDQLRAAPMFKSAPGALHEPPPGFSEPLESFKSRDPHANLQVTFMPSLTTKWPAIARPEERVAVAVSLYVGVASCLCGVARREGPRPTRCLQLWLCENLCVRYVLRFAGAPWLACRAGSDSGRC